jgi:hypothetical protein
VNYSSVNYAPVNLGQQIMDPARAAAAARDRGTSIPSPAGPQGRIVAIGRYNRPSLRDVPPVWRRGSPVLKIYIRPTIAAGDQDSVLTAPGRARFRFSLV